MHTYVVTVLYVLRYAMYNIIICMVDNNFTVSAMT